MAKLYFKYGVMGSSKTAQALIAKFNYEQGNNKVLLLKPAIDTRDGDEYIKSRVGLYAKAVVIPNDFDIRKSFDSKNKPDVIICDESQFFTEKQIEQLKEIACNSDIPVICYGLKTDFMTHMFEGSKRLFELADSIQEIKMVCDCGRKAEVNARIDSNGNVIREGEQIVLGGNDLYKSMCFKCYMKSR